MGRESEANFNVTTYGGGVGIGGPLGERAILGVMAANHSLIQKIMQITVGLYTVGCA
jgi:hypothetical protein